MKPVHLINTQRSKIYLFAAALILASAAIASAQTTEFTYQGRLLDNNVPATASYDFQFRLWSALNGGTPIGAVQSINNVAVSGGIFTVKLDFGDQFYTGADRFLEIEVRSAGGPAFTTLTPRQPITAAPYSIKSLTANSSDGLTHFCTLCVTDAKIMSVSAAKITGTVAIANGGTGSSSKNFVDLSTDQAITGNKTFSGAVAVTGADGVFNGNGSGLTNLNGANITNNTITTQQLSGDATPSSSSLKMLGSLRWDLLKGRTTYAAGTDPYGLAFDGANLWASNNGSSGTVTKVRLSDGTTLGTFPVGSFPNAVAFDGANIWVVNGVGNTVTKLRASDGACVGTCTFPVGSAPAAIVFDGSSVWVANGGGSTVTRLRASDGACVGTCTYNVGTGPRGIAYDGMYIWVANSSADSVTRLLAFNGACVAPCTFPVGDNPRGIVSDGTNVWVANFNDDTVTRLRGGDGTCVVPCTFPVAHQPFGMVFDGSAIWVGNSGANWITKLSASDGSNLGIFHTSAAQPLGGAFDGSNVWFAHFGSNALVRMQPSFPKP